MPDSIVFLDLDDVICLNQPYGGYDVRRSASACPEDLWTKLFDAGCKDVLLQSIAEFNPRIVLTTSWLRFFERDGFVALLGNSGLTAVAEALHEKWECPQVAGTTRLQAIQAWLNQHHNGEAFVVIDDTLSGTGLKGSALDRAGRVVLCKVDSGLQPAHLLRIRKALSTVMARNGSAY